MSNNPNNSSEEQEKPINYRLFKVKNSLKKIYYSYIEIPIKSLGVLAGGSLVIFNMWAYLDTQHNLKTERTRKELSSYATYGDLLKEYRDKIQPAMGRFLENFEKMSEISTVKNTEDLEKRYYSLCF